MQINEYVSNFQPILQRTFSNAIKNDQVAHAYLLSGLPGIPLKEIAIYMAKSLVCDNPNPLADLTCNTCKRIDNLEYPDFIILDGSEDTIKKDDIHQIIDTFSQSALERKGKMIYIIHLVETMNDESINCLLKFLEEPNKGVYAILTTENDNKILPTIISRCETIRFVLRPVESVKREAIELGVAKDDADLLSPLINDANLIKERSQTLEYKQVKEAFNILTKNLNNKQNARFTMENKGIPLIKGKPALRLFFDLLTQFYLDLLNKQKGNPIKLEFYDNILSNLTSLKNVENKLKNIMILRRQAELNIHSGLLLVHLIKTITED